MIEIKPVAIKAIAGLVGLGGVGAIAHQSYLAINNKEKNDMGNRLKKDGYVLLTKDSTNIDTILASYQSVTTSNNNLKLGVFGGVDTNDKKAKDELLKLCDSIFKEEKDSKSYNKAIKWCVEPIPVSGILKKQGTIALKTGSDANTDKKKWEGKIKKHIDSANNLSKISQLNLTSTADKMVEDDYKIIQDKCDEIGKINNHTATFEDSLKLFKLWCSDN